MWGRERARGRERELLDKCDWCDESSDWGCANKGPDPVAALSMHACIRQNEPERTRHAEHEHPATPSLCILNNPPHIAACCNLLPLPDMHRRINLSQTMLFLFVF